MFNGKKLPFLEFFYNKLTDVKLEVIEMTGKELNQLRKEKKISFNELAQLSGLPKSTLEKVLFEITPHPRIDTVQAIEKALGISSEPQSNEITEERLQALGFDLTAISDISEEDLQLIRSTLKTLVTELKDRKKK